MTGVSAGPGCYLAMAIKILGITLFWHKAEGTHGDGFVPKQLKFHSDNQNLNIYPQSKL